MGALASPVRNANVVLCHGVSLVGGQTIPFDSFGIVTRDTMTLAVRITKNLAHRVTLGPQPNDTT